MNVTAACSSAIRSVLQAPPRPAEVLGVVDTAMYLRVDEGVVGLLTADAVRLPCALTLGTTSRDLPLTTLRPVDGGVVTIGGGRVEWLSATGPVTVSVVREWEPARPGAVTPRAERVAELRCRVPDDGRPSVARLLGAGPGLTPRGDDILAGYLVASGSFGVDVSDVAAAIERDAHRTTALSAVLLRHAARGECVPQLAALVRAVGGVGDLGTAVDALLAVGNTSGVALAEGVAAAAAEALATTDVTA